MTVFRDPLWRTKIAPVVPPLRVVERLNATGIPVDWCNGEDHTDDESIEVSKRWNARMFYLTEFAEGVLVTRLLPGSVMPAAGWLK